MRIMKEKYLSQSSVVLRMQKNNVDFPAYCSMLLHLVNRAGLLAPFINVHVNSFHANVYLS